MSTTFTLLHEELPDSYMFEFTVTESSAQYYIEMDKLDNITGEWAGELSTRKLPPEEILIIALGLIYAVWCSYPDMADVFVRSLDEDLVGMYNCREDKFKDYLRG